MPFIPDATPGFVPDSTGNPGNSPKPTPGFTPDKPVSFKERVKGSSYVRKGLGLAKDALLGNLPFKASKTALEISNKIDAPIEKFRSETLPDKITPTRQGIEDRAFQTGKVPYGDIVKRTAAETAGEVAIPTTKEAAAGFLAGPFVKPVAGFLGKGLEKISPKFAASQGVKREVAALGRIKEANLSQPTFKSTELIGKVNERMKEATKDFLLPARKETDGKIKQVWSHNEYDAAGKMTPAKGENGFIDSDGKFFSIKDINTRIQAGEDITGLLKGTKSVPNLRKQFIKEEVDSLAKETVGDLNPPKELEPKSTGLPGIKRSFKADLAKQIFPEESALRKQGMNGKQLADDAMNFVQDSQVMAGKLQSKTLPDLMKLPEDIRAQIPDFLEPRPGKSRPNLAGEARRVADGMRNQLKAIGRFLEKQDIEVIRDGKKSKFYAKNQFFPRSLDVEKLSGDLGVYHDELQHLLKTKQVDSMAEGKQVLDAALKTRSNIFAPDDFTNFYGTKKLSTIERPRIYTFKNVTNDPVENYVNYTSNVSRRINQIKYFGQKGEFLNQRLAEIGNEGGDANFAQGVMNRLLNQASKDESGTYLVKQLRAFQGATKLTRSAIPNLQQGIVNSYIRSQSEPSVVKGFKKAFSKEGVEFARKAGVVGNKEVDTYMEQIAGMSEDVDASSMEKIANWLGKHSGFKKSEELNRIQAANIGREYINELAAKYVKNPKGKIGTKTLKEELTGYRVDVERLGKTGKLTANEELHAANKFVGETQFGTKPLGTPAIFNSSAFGKVAGQFSMFPVQQGRLVLDAVKRHPVKTAPVILGTSVGIGAPLGMVSNMAAGKKPVDADPKDNASKAMAKFVLQAVMNSGALGKAGSIVNAADYGAEAVMGQLTGPTISETGKLIYNARQASKGNVKPLARQALSQIPFVGKAASNILLPSKKKKKN